MISLKKYYLPDSEFLKEKDNDGCMVWAPRKKIIILGASNKIEDSLITDTVIRDKIDVVKRKSGGQSVILTKNTVIISIKTKRDQINVTRYFSVFTEQIIDVLSEVGVSGLEKKGTSDIVIGNKKISGSAIYQNREFVLFHAVINISEPPRTFDKYLAHPSREPEYRAGRSHSDFVTSLSAKGYKVEPKILMELLKKRFSKNLKQIKKRRIKNESKNI